MLLQKKKKNPYVYSSRPNADAAGTERWHLLFQRENILVNTYLNDNKH